MSKGTAIDRVLAFYRTASSDTVRVTHQLAVEVMAERGIGSKSKSKGGAGSGGTRRGRKPKPTSTSEAGAAKGSEVS